jgi:hypothetical protein
MRSPVKIIIVVALTFCAAIGLRHAQGQNGFKSNPGRVSVVAAVRNRPLEDSAVRVRDGSFILKNLTLTKMSGSTLLRGDLVNKTKQKQDSVFFEVRAYDPEGRLLKGLESRTIFAAQKLKAGRAVPINHGYGVWLQGIALEKIARVEIVEASTESGRSALSRTIPLASHALSLKRDVEIEE